jgi:hypothetical protein
MSQFEINFEKWLFQSKAESDKWNPFTKTMEDIFKNLPKVKQVKKYRFNPHIEDFNENN